MCVLGRQIWIQSTVYIVHCSEFCEVNSLQWQVLNILLKSNLWTPASSLDQNQCLTCVFYSTMWLVCSAEPLPQNGGTSKWVVKCFTNVHGWWCKMSARSCGVCFSLKLLRLPLHKVPLIPWIPDYFLWPFFIIKCIFLFKKTNKVCVIIKCRWVSLKIIYKIET